ncbi:MAG: hypothetical protein ACRDGM_03125 [bacterium]
MSVQNARRGGLPIPDPRDGVFHHLLQERLLATAVIEQAIWDIQNFAHASAILEAALARAVAAPKTLAADYLRIKSGNDLLELRRFHRTARQFLAHDLWDPESPCHLWVQLLAPGLPMEAVKSRLIALATDQPLTTREPNWNIPRPASASLNLVVHPPIDVDDTGPGARQADPDLVAAA